jgi:hypothetical protein
MLRQIPPVSGDSLTHATGRLINFTERILY